MKRKNNKKGFTIVELVIVIAVIAILAAVLIPTFSGVVKKANESAALQEATNAYKEAYALALADGKIDKDDEEVVAQNFKFKFSGSLEHLTVTCEDVPQGFDYKVTITGGVVSVTEKTNTNVASEGEQD